MIIKIYITLLHKGIVIDVFYEDIQMLFFPVSSLDKSQDK